MTPTNPYEAAKQQIKPAFSKSQFRVFVLGPGLRDDEIVAKPSVKSDSHEAVIEHARYLRYATKQALEAAQFSVDFGETEQMLKFWQEHFGAVDPGSSELLQAHRISGAVVVYPSSVGSLCELGMFAPQKNISEKTLAIVHERYKNDNSFFRKALLEVLTQENGKVEFKDYSDHDACVAEAMRFVTGKYQSLLRDHALIRNADLLRNKYHGTVYNHQ